MLKMTKISTIVAFIVLVMASSAHAKKIKNPTFKKVRKSLWYMGVDGPSLKEVELHIESEQKDKRGPQGLPEELSKALKKVRGL